MERREEFEYARYRTLGKVMRKVPGKDIASNISTMDW
jgi:hypothetical protein